MIIPTVVQAIAGPDFTVYAFFSDGSVRLYDAKPLLAKGGVFSQLANAETFESTLTVMNGAAAWDIAGTRDEAACIDIDPVTMYEQSFVVPDPLREIA